jgi:hypothetical protein
MVPFVSPKNNLVREFSFSGAEELVEFDDDDGDRDDDNDEEEPILTSEV